jgi:uncharacterized membrane protein
MESRAKILGHSAHQLLIVFPLGLLSTAVVFDVIHLAGGAATAAVVACWVAASGVVGGLVAAPFGWIDWFAIPRGMRAKSVGLAHGLTNVAVIGLFAASWLLRPDGGESPGALALALSFADAGLALVGGWLGGELVSRLGVAVHDGAHLDSPNSLSGRPATDSVKRPPGA